MSSELPASASTFTQMPLPKGSIKHNLQTFIEVGALKFYFFFHEKGSWQEVIL